MEGRQIVLIAHNIRSTHNVGSLLRTADGLGIQSAYLTGYSPYPLAADEQRLPHLAHKISRQISKTALGAEQTVAWKHVDDIQELISELKTEGYEVVALEQTPQSTQLADYRPPAKVVLIVGNEVKGLDAGTIQLCSHVVQIPMLGAKESFNVAVAAAIGLHYLRHQP